MKEIREVDERGCAIRRGSRRSKVPSPAVSMCMMERRRVGMTYLRRGAGHREKESESGDRRYTAVADGSDQMPQPQMQAAHFGR